MNFLWAVSVVLFMRLRSHHLGKWGKRKISWEAVQCASQEMCNLLPAKHNLSKKSWQITTRHGRQAPLCFGLKPAIKARGWWLSQSVNSESVPYLFQPGNSTRIEGWANSSARRVLLCARNLWLHTPKNNSLEEKSWNTKLAGFQTAR